MQKYLACITSVCLFFAQQNVLLAQTGTTPPTGGATDANGGSSTENTSGGMTDASGGNATDNGTDGATDGTDGTDGTGDATDGMTEAPSGMPAAVETPEDTGGGGGGGGAGVVLLGGAIIGLVVLNNKRKLEKTLVSDPALGARLTQLSHRDKQGVLQWDMQFGSLAQKDQHKQQLINWQLSKRFADNVRLRTSFGFSADVFSEKNSNQRRWLSADLNKTSVFKTDDVLNLSFGQVFKHGLSEVESTTAAHYFSPALATTDLRGVSKNSAEQGRYINLMYSRPFSAATAFNLQWQYSKSSESLRQIGATANSNMHVLLNWQYRY